MYLTKDVSGTTCVWIYHTLVAQLVLNAQPPRMAYINIVNRYTENSKRRHNTKQATGPSKKTNAKPPERISEPQNPNSKLQHLHVRAIQQKQKAKDEQRPESIRRTETFPPTPVYEHKRVHKNQSSPGKKQNTKTKIRPVSNMLYILENTA